MKDKTLTIAFLGPDGSGKSTIIDLIMKERLSFNKIYYFHLKPLRKRIVTQVVSNPHQDLPYSPLKSYFKLLYLIYQYNYGWIKNVFPLRRKSTLVIFDRYFDDILVDQKRYRYGGKLNMVKFALKFIPRPDAYFILSADASVIFTRKKEVTFNELKRQLRSYKNLVDNIRYFNIDVNRKPEEVFNEILLKLNKIK